MTGIEIATMVLSAQQDIDFGDDCPHAPRVVKLAAEIERLRAGVRDVARWLDTKDDDFGFIDKAAERLRSLL